MAAPHAFRIHPGISTAAESAPETRFLTLWPGLASTFLQVFFLGRAPTPGGFELSRIWNGMGVVIPRGDEILWVQKPVFIVRHDVICETLGILLGVRKSCERGVEKGGAWVRRCGVHGIHDVS